MDKDWHFCPLHLPMQINSVVQGSSESENENIPTIDDTSVTDIKAIRNSIKSGTAAEDTSLSDSHSFDSTPHPVNKHNNDAHLSNSDKNLHEEYCTSSEDDDITTETNNIEGVAHKQGGDNFSEYEDTLSSENHVSFRFQHTKPDTIEEMKENALPLLAAGSIEFKRVSQESPLPVWFINEQDEPSDTSGKKNKKNSDIECLYTSKIHPTNSYENTIHLEHNLQEYNSGLKNCLEVIHSTSRTGSKTNQIFKERDLLVYVQQRKSESRIFLPSKEDETFKNKQIYTRESRHISLQKQLPYSNPEPELVTVPVEKKSLYQNRENISKLSINDTDDSKDVLPEKYLGSEVELLISNKQVPVEIIMNRGQTTEPAFYSRSLFEEQDDPTSNQRRRNIRKRQSARRASSEGRRMSVQSKLLPGELPANIMDDTSDGGKRNEEMNSTTFQEYSERKTRSQTNKYISDIISKINSKYCGQQMHYKPKLHMYMWNKMSEDEEESLGIATQQVTQNIVVYRQLFDRLYGVNRKKYKRDEMRLPHNEGQSECEPLSKNKSMHAKKLNENQINEGPEVSEDSLVLVFDVQNSPKFNLKVANGERNLDNLTETPEQLVPTENNIKENISSQGSAEIWQNNNMEYTGQDLVRAVEEKLLPYKTRKAEGSVCAEEIINELLNKDSDSSDEKSFSSEYIDRDDKIPEVSSKEFNPPPVNVNEDMIEIKPRSQEVPSTTTDFPLTSQTDNIVTTDTDVSEVVGTANNDPPLKPDEVKRAKITNPEDYEYIIIRPLKRDKAMTSDLIQYIEMPIISESLIKRLSRHSKLLELSSDEESESDTDRVRTYSSAHERSQAPQSDEQHNVLTESSELSIEAHDPTQKEGHSKSRKKSFLQGLAAKIKRKNQNNIKEIMGPPKSRESRRSEDGRTSDYQFQSEDSEEFKPLKREKRGSDGRRSASIKAGSRTGSSVEGFQPGAGRAQLASQGQHHLGQIERPDYILSAPEVVTPEEIGFYFRRGFRPDNLALSGEVCFLAGPNRRLQYQGDNNADPRITFSENEEPLDFLISLGFGVDEATLALKEEEVKIRLSAALAEARIWVNSLTKTQGTLLYFLAYKATPKVMRFYLQLVESIVNQRITNAIKLDGFLRLLERVEDGYISLLPTAAYEMRGPGQEDLDAQRKLKKLFFYLYKTAEEESRFIRDAPLDERSLALLRLLATKNRPAIQPHFDLLARYIGQGLLTTQVQLEAAVIYVTRLDTNEVNFLEFEDYCGISEVKDIIEKQESNPDIY